MRDIALAFAAGFALGIVVAAILTHAFWRTFFEGCLREVTTQIVDAYQQTRRNGK